MKIAVDCAQANAQSGQAPKVAQDPGSIAKAAPGPVMRLIAGPCLIESRDHCMRMAEALAMMTCDLDVEFIFKASWDKANRTSLRAPRGSVGSVEAGLEVLTQVSLECDLMVCTDLHETEQILKSSSELLPDVIQIPAMLSRQTDLIQCAALYGRQRPGIINIKKSQGMAPADMAHAVQKARAVEPRTHIMVTERGYSFGYNNLVVDMRSIPIMKATSGADEVLFDCTHSVQLPSAMAGVSGGDRRYIEPLARAAIAAGADGLFCEVHDDPEKALSDGPCQIPLRHFPDFLKRMLELYEWQQAHPSSSFPLE